jgi:hypothetical protein
VLVVTSVWALSVVVALFIPHLFENSPRLHPQVKVGGPGRNRVNPFGGCTVVPITGLVHSLVGCVKIMVKWHCMCYDNTSCCHFRVRLLNHSDREYSSNRLDVEGLLVLQMIMTDSRPLLVAVQGRSDVHITLFQS